ncbi:MAG: DNA repair protein RadA [Actinomycetes bacterium]
MNPTSPATNRTGAVRSPPRARTRAGFRCEECGATTSRWVGRCLQCQAWGAVVADEPAGGRAGGLRTVPATITTGQASPIGRVDPSGARVEATGVDELDRVLGGGLVGGSVVLVAGEPGVGKSTLLLDVAARVARSRRRALYVTGEESAAQVRVRAERIGALAEQLFLAAETDLGRVLGQVEALDPGLLVVDSVQTVASGGLEGGPGSIAQVREVAAALIAAAKERGMATLLVGHVTKDGAIAGPRVLEHLVDVVVHFEGDRHSRLRMLRAVKNRYGPTDEVGCFDLGEAGIVGLPDPSGLFLSPRAEPVAGTCLTVTLEGTRPLPAEVQALVAPSPLSTPRRVTNGLDASRVAMVLAVLERRGGVGLGSHDVYTATVGGVRVAEPAADLAVVLAVASAAVDRALPAGLVAVGEVGLAGEVRPTRGVGRRLAEAARLGLRHALVPIDAGPVPEGMTVFPVSDLHDALRVLGQPTSGRCSSG